MKQTEKSILIIIIIILMVVIAIGANYLILNNKETNKIENPTESSLENKSDSIKLTNTAITNNNITENYNIIINGKQKTLKVNFSWEDYNEEDYNGHAYTLKGTFNNTEFLDLKYSDEIVNFFNIPNIKNLLNTSNFHFIKGTDNKNYLLIAFDISSDLSPSSGKLYIYNDDLNLIDTLIIKDGNVGWKLENNTYPYYEDTFSMCDNFDLYNNICNIKVKIDNNEIYYLQDNLNSDTSSSIGYVEERIYTLNNSKLTYKTINKYKISSLAYGQY